MLQMTINAEIQWANKNNLNYHHKHFCAGLLKCEHLNRKSTEEWKLLQTNSCVQWLLDLMARTLMTFKGFLHLNTW